MFGDYRPGSVFSNHSQEHRSTLSISVRFSIFESDTTPIEWCFTPLSTVFQSYHGNSSHYSCLSLVSPVLGWGSAVSCPSTFPQ